MSSSARSLHSAFLALVVALGLPALATPAPARAAQARKYEGRPVADVLKELQSPELQIIFSSDLVPSTLRVKSDPAAGAPRQIARQILAQHALTLEPGPRGRWLVVRAPDRQESPPEKERQRTPSARPSRDPAPPDPVHIEEWVEVTQRLNDAGGHAGSYTLDALTIRETAGGFENILQVLPLLPPAAATNDEDGKVSVRGSGPEHNVVVIDGVQIHNPYRLGELTSSFLNPATAASVRLDASGLDARHGGRLSSVTIIETRDGAPDRALAVSGSLGLTSGDVLLEGRLPDTGTGSWWATARGTYYRPVINRLTSDAVPGFFDAQFKIAVRPTPKTRLTLFGLVGREAARELDRESDVGDTDGDGGRSPAPGLIVPGPSYSGINRLAVMNLWWTEGPRVASTTTISAYGHDAREYDGSLVFAGVDPFDRRTGVHDFAARQRIVFAPTSTHLLDTGVEVHRIGSTWRMQEEKPPIFPRGLGPSTWGENVDYSQGTIDSRLARTQAGFWFQHRVGFAGTWGIEPAVRLDWNSFTREASWQPRLRVSGRVGNTTVWAGVAVQVQTPSHEALQGSDYFHLTPDAGQRLRNERSRQIVAGLEQPLGAGFRVRAEAYRRQFDRLLVQRLENEAERAARLAGFAIPPDLPPDSAILEYRPTMFPESTGHGRAVGLELQVEREGRRVSGFLAYTLSRATRESYGYELPFDFDRPHAIKGSVSMQVSRRVRVSAAWQHASGFPMTPLHEEVRFLHPIALDGTIGPVAVTSRASDGSLRTTITPRMRRLSLRNTERLNGYSRADVRATYSTLGRWEFYGEILNVFNQRNYVHRIDLPPSFGAGAGAVSENNIFNYFERLPSFGIRVRF